MVIEIRRAVKGDAEGVARFVNDGIRSGRSIYIGANKVWNKKKIRQVDESFLEGSGRYCFVAVDNEKDLIVGSVSFSFKKEGRLRHRIELGWFVDYDYSSNGIGTKLVRACLKLAKEKGFRRAEAEIAVKNLGSVKLAEKCGFKIEGVRKRGMILDSGRYCDTYIVGRLL